MRRREAEARCPGVVGGRRRPRARSPHVRARWRGRWRRSRRASFSTVRVAARFPTRGPSRYFGGDARARRRGSRRDRRALGADDVRVGIADGEFTAGLAARRARAGEPMVVEAGRDRGVPRTVAGVGVRRRSSSASLARPARACTRSGRRGAAVGRGARALRHRRAACSTSSRTGSTRSAGAGVAAARSRRAGRAGSAGDACRRRRVRGQGARRPVARTARPNAGSRARASLVEAETEHGERLARCWRHEGALSPRDAGRTGALAARRLAHRRRSRARAQSKATCAPSRISLCSPSRLDSTTGALTLVRLVPDEVVPAHGRQLGFWGGDQAARDRADRALARVQGMLGYETVATAVVQGGRTPTEQVRWVPWGEPREPDQPLRSAPNGRRGPARCRRRIPRACSRRPCPRCSSTTEAARRRDRAAAKLGRARPARSAACLPGGGGAVRAWAGPWAHDLRWWDPRIAAGACSGKSSSKAPTRAKSHASSPSKPAPPASKPSTTDPSTNRRQNQTLKD